MRIETIQSSVSIPAAPLPSQGGTPEQPGQPGPAVGRAESVRISDEARERAVRTPPVKFPAEPLTTEHVARIRRRILSGAYEALDVVELVAGRVLSSQVLTTGSASGED